MSAAGGAGPDPLDDAILAARLCAIDPGLGGLILRGGGEARNGVIAALGQTLPKGTQIRRVPAYIDDERLLGGLDLTATLAAGRPVARAGLLAEAAGGAIILPMAERLPDAIAGRIAAAIDDGPPFITVAFDDGREPEERPPAALAERLAFWLDLAACRRPEPAAVASDPAESCAPPSSEALQGIAATAAALGVDSARASLFALRAAAAAARLAGRTAIEAADVALAARLVLAPRATRWPAETETPAHEPPPPPADGGEANRDNADAGLVEDVVLAAAMAALPQDVLARIAEGRSRRSAPRTTGAGERRKSHARGRPLGARAGIPDGRRRLSLIDTLRAAAPWQTLRRRDGLIKIRRDDLRVRRFQQRAQALTIFAVDASGSSAVARLAEAKGAVELLLAEAYVKRAEVALIAFRGAAAELLLPPTRSLARARRALGDLPGGGGTPLAAGLNAARDLAESARSRGRTPFIVVLTDGRANVGADGNAGGTAQADAEKAARAIGAAGIAGAFVDISARPRSEGADLAAAMGVRYLPLPRADAAAMHAAVSAVRSA